MSSKVLSDLATAPVQAMAWRTVGPGGLLGPRAEPLAAPPPGALGQLQGRLAELEQQARQREQEAFESGRRQGHAAAAEEAKARLEPVLEGLSRATEEIVEQRRRYRREAEEDVVRLSVAIARRILHRELGSDPEALLGVVKAALQKVEAREVHRLRVHPSEAPLLRQHFEQTGRLGRFEVQGDATLGRGAVLLDTERGSLDASVETQLEEIQRGLTDLIHGSR